MRILPSQDLPNLLSRMARYSTLIFDFALMLSGSWQCRLLFLLSAERSTFSSFVARVLPIQDSDLHIQLFISFQSDAQQRERKI